MSQEESRQFSKTVSNSDDAPLSLDDARIMTPSEVASTPSTRKVRHAFKRNSASSSNSDQEDMRILATRSMVKKKKEE